MRYLIICSLFLCLIFSACSVEEPSKNPNLISKWELMEVLESSGGAAVFEPSENKETIEFLIDEKVRRSTSWCSEGNVNVAQYSAEEGKIFVGCGKDQFSLRYTIKGNFLLVYPNCIEQCALKYRRIDNLVGFVR